MQMTNGGDSQKQHVALFVFPFSSHVSVTLSLVRRLAEASPDVKFSLLNTAKSNVGISSMLTAQGFSNVKAYDVDDGMPEGHVLSGNPQEAVDLFLNAATPENYKRYVEAAVAETGRKISCLLTDAFLWFAGEMAEEMQVPWVSLWVSSAFSLGVHVYTYEIRQKFGVTGIAGREEETLDFIPGLSTMRVADLPEGVISGNLESPFLRMLHNMGSMLPKATTVVINSFEGLEPFGVDYLKLKFRKFHHVGPLTLTSPQPSSSDVYGCLPWLDKHKASSVAYISFGNVITPPPNELVALAEAIEASGVPFLWSIKDNMKHHLPKGFLERTSCGEKAKVVPWAPQLQVLAHASVGVYINHCGWNSVQESIACGVPMVCRPFFADHGLNIRMIESVWKIGVGVEGGVFTKNGTMKAVEQILLHDEGKKMRERIGVLKEVGAKAVGPEGSSVKNFRCLLDDLSAH